MWSTGCTGRLSPGTPASPHSEITETPRSLPVRETLDNLLQFLFQSLQNEKVQTFL